MLAVCGRGGEEADGEREQKKIKSLCIYK